MSLISYGLSGIFVVIVEGEIFLQHTVAKRGMGKMGVEQNEVLRSVGIRMEVWNWITINIM